MKPKNVGVILATVVVLIGLTYWADKVTKPKPGSTHADTSSAKNIAQPAPDVHFKDLGDKDVTLTDYNGKVVLVNFWATWCDPCREEIPWLIEMQHQYSGRGFTVLGVAMDEEGKSVVAPFVAKEHFDVGGGQKETMSYPIVIGTDAIADKFGGLLGYPTSVLISRDGKQIKRITGLISPDDIRHAIEAAL